VLDEPGMANDCRGSACRLMWLLGGDSLRRQSKFGCLLLELSIMNLQRAIVMSKMFVPEIGKRKSKGRTLEVNEGAMGVNPDRRHVDWSFRRFELGTERRSNAFSFYSG